MFLNRTTSPCFDRRTLLKFTLGSLLPGALSGAARANPGGGKRELPLIMLFLSGGPSQKETFIPDERSAPEELRGKLGTIPTAISGVHFCELWPLLAERANRFALLRGLTSGSSDHFASARNLFRPESQETLGVRWGERSADGGVPYVLVQCPTLYTVMDAFEQSKSMHIRWRRNHDLSPTLSDWERDLIGEGEYVAPEFRADPQLAERRQLLEKLDTLSLPSDAMDRRDRCYQLAFSLLLGGGTFFEAFRPPASEQREYARDLERYGAESRVGRALLLARRLTERGAGCCVVYHELGRGWDMHDDLFSRIPALAAETDRAAAALLDDMQRGRSNCVFAMLGEFGRTPRVNDRGGRDHWGEGFPGIFAGGRFMPGVVHGRTTAQGSVRDGLVAPAALGPTLIYAAGGEIGATEPRVREILRSST